MAKFYGKIGYAKTIEVSPGVYNDGIIDRNYYGDIVRNTRRLQPSEHLNDDITINNTISIISDVYAYENFHSIRYVEFGGTKWKVNNVEVQFPRLILTLGGVYNG